MVTSCTISIVCPYKANALCKKIVQKFQKIVSKSCFNFTFLTILACQALLVDNNPLCKFEEIFWNHKKYTIFDENSCLALPVTLYLVRFCKICLATASRHCSTHQLNTLYQWRDLFFTFLGLEDQTKMINFWLRIST